MRMTRVTRWRLALRQHHRHHSLLVFLLMDCDGQATELHNLDGQATELQDLHGQATELQDLDGLATEL